MFQLENKIVRTHILGLIRYYHQNIGSHLEIILILRDWVYPFKEIYPKHSMLKDHSILNYSFVS